MIFQAHNHAQSHITSSYANPISARSYMICRTSAIFVCPVGRTGALSRLAVIQLCHIVLDSSQDTSADHSVSFQRHSKDNHLVVWQRPPRRLRRRPRHLIPTQDGTMGWQGQDLDLRKASMGGPRSCLCPGAV